MGATTIVAEASGRAADGAVQTRDDSRRDARPSTIKGG